MLKGLLVFSLASLLTLSACGPEDESQYFPTSVGVETRIAAKGLDHPWELVWGPDNWIWFTERDGNIGRLNPETGEVVRLLTISDVLQVQESGLLGMVLHPDFPNTPYLYVSYTYDEDAPKGHVVRYTFDGTTLKDPLVLLDGIKANNIHNGSRLTIVGDKLFITAGDSGNQSLPQDQNSMNGKIFSINLDCTIPGDNPFPKSPVWSLGHRNPQGLVMASNGIMYSSEHGPNNDDEVNIIEKGRNYGWPTVQGFADGQNEKTFATAHNTLDPIAAWTPTLAVSGMTYYDKDLIPQWKNCLLLMTLKEQQLMVLKLSEDGRSVVSQEKAFDEQFGRLRAVCVSPDGRVFFSTNDQGSDKVIEVKPSTAKRKASVNETSGLEPLAKTAASLINSI
jgi:aldose sugar dehydrogenase